MNFFLSQPYPYPVQNPRRWLISSAGAGLFVALFLLIFQPFGSDGWNDPKKPFVLAGYGLITFCFLLIDGFVVPKWFKTWHSEQNWTVGREILWSLFVIITITFGNLFYGQLVLGTGFSLENLVRWFFVTTSIGIIPSTIVTLVNYNILLRKHATTNFQVSPILPAQSAAELTLIAENQKDAHTISVANLLFIESADNYSEVVSWQIDKAQKILLRSSLGRLEEQIVEQPNVVRCHRSYIVNLTQVIGVSGNAQGYKLTLKNGVFSVPVSRRYAGLVASYFRK